jgi:hypothetical protein
MIFMTIMTMLMSGVRGCGGGVGGEMIVFIC